MSTTSKSKIVYTYEKSSKYLVTQMNFRLILPCQVYFKLYPAVVIRSSLLDNILTFL